MDFDIASFLIQNRPAADIQNDLSKGVGFAEQLQKLINRKKTPLTIEALREWLSDNGISVRRNVINHTIEIDGLDAEYDCETVSSSLHVILHDRLKDEFVCTSSLVSDLLDVVSGMSRFNPVLDMLKAAPPWDGVDRAEQLTDILHIPADDALSRVLLRKWLWQCLAMANNDLGGAYGADGMLVLQGPQGIGKTTFCRVLAVRPDLVKTGMYIDSRDKDTLRRTTSCWIAELGEVETTLRSDLERLKAFVTAECDIYRLPYGRSDQTLARRTSLIATCNSTRFLIDPTGSRRFWTIPVAQIDLQALNDFDALQLWKQIEEEIAGDPQCFRLTQIEQAELARRNGAHEKPLKAQMECEDILADAAERPAAFIWVYQSVSDFKTDNQILSHYSVEQIAKALDKLGIKAERKTVNGKQIRARYLPRHNWTIAKTA